jgi:hypothetical protein
MSWDVQVPFLSENVIRCVSVLGLPKYYIDLANTYLFVEAQIVDDDDAAFDGGENVGPVNLWIHSLFSDVSVSLNENLVSK